MTDMEHVPPPSSSSSSVRTVAIVATVIALLGLSIPFTWGGHDDASGEPITAPLLDPVAAHASSAPEEFEQGDAACMANAKPATDFTLPGLDGKAVKLSAYKGKVVLLNFWATWCEPCRAEMPALQALAERLGPSRLAVVGVNYQESAARIERFVEAAALTFPVLLDRDGAVTRAWTRRIFPTSVLVGPDGRARQVIVGEFDWNGPQAGGLLAALLPR